MLFGAFVLDFYCMEEEVTDQCKKISLEEEGEMPYDSWLRASSCYC